MYYIQFIIAKVGVKKIKKSGPRVPRYRQLRHTQSKKTKRKTGGRGETFSLCRVRGAQWYIWQNSVMEWLLMASKKATLFSRFFPSFLHIMQKKIKKLLLLNQK